MDGGDAACDACGGDAYGASDAFEPGLLPILP